MAFFFSLLSAPYGSASEGDVYNFSWLDPDKEIYVLQNRKFRKNGRPYVGLGFGKTTSGAFVDGTNIQGRAGFFFREEWGIEVVLSKNSGEENVTARSVRNEGATPFRRVVEGYYGAMLSWAPFYSKINTFNQIVYLDWIFGAGYGNVSEKNNKTEFFDAGPGGGTIVDQLDSSALLWQAALKLYLTPRWNVRLNLVTLHYKGDHPLNSSTEESKKVWNHHYDLNLSVGMTF